MIWSKDALFSNAKQLISRAFNEERDSPFFGVFCSIGLELLARSALAAFSPALLADKGHDNLLYALELKDSVNKPKSIPMNQVASLCCELIDEFNPDLQKFMNVMAECRNESLHSGGDGFSDYNVDKWLVWFYKTCNVLCKSLNKPLESLLGKDITDEAQKIISQNSVTIMNEVNNKIHLCKETYLRAFDDDKESVVASIEFAKSLIKLKTYSGAHSVVCPSCGNQAMITGKEPRMGHEAIEKNEVIVHKDVTAEKFECMVCGLTLNSYAELQCAGLPLHYSRVNRYDPTEYFDIDIDSIKDMLFDDDSYRDDF